MLSLNCTFGSWFGWNALSFHICHLEYVFEMSPEKYQTCFLIIMYWFLTLLLVSEDQSYCEALTVWVLLLCRLRWICAEMILWLEDNTLREELATKFRTLFIHFKPVLDWKSATFDLLSCVNWIYHFHLCYMSIHVSTHDWNIVFRNVMSKGK